MSEKFPEEGGDPEYWIGYLLSGSGDYEAAKKSFIGVKPESPLYLNALYHIVNSDYLAFNEKEEDTQTKEEREALIVRFNEVVTKVTKVESKPDNIDDKTWKIYEGRKSDVFYSCIGKVAKLYYKVEDFANAKVINKRMIKYNFLVMVSFFN